MTNNPNSEAFIRATVTISGKVQGVYFRVSTQATAQDLGLTGWVRNLPNGDVQAVFEGPRDAVEKIVAWCHHGPPKARVNQVSVEWGQSTGQFQDFTIRRT